MVNTPPPIAREVARAFLVSAAASAGTVTGFVLAGYFVTEYTKRRKRPKLAKQPPMTSPNI